MKRFLVWVSLLLGLSSLVLGEETKKELFVGDQLPVPPAQTTPFTPPTTKLPTEAIDAVNELFNQGFPDPRGCEYREVQLLIGADIPPYKDKVHAWVIPSTASPKFAICWDGQIYPLSGEGEKADLAQDIKSMLKNQEPFRNNGETKELDGTVPFLIKVPLLWRLGEGAAAEKIYTTQPEPYADYSHGYQKVERPYEALYNDWMDYRIERALYEHQFWEDHLALIDCKALHLLFPKAEAKLVELRGNERRYDTDVVEELLADETRRSLEPAYTPVLQMKPSPTGGDRIAGLTRDMEGING